MNMLFLVLGIVILVIILFLLDRPGPLFDGLILFSSAINTDIENLLTTSFRKCGRDVSYKKREGYTVVTQGDNALFLEFHNEPIPRNFVEGLISSFPGLSYEEIDLLKNHQASISFRTLINPRKSKDLALFIVQAVLALLRQEGAVGFIAGPAPSYYPVRHFDRYMGETVLRIEEFYYLFDKAQNVKR
jgi:hypothetical protein